MGFIRNFIKRVVIEEFLQPKIEIVSDKLPEFASPNSAGVDLIADLRYIKSKFFINSEIKEGKLIIHPNGQCLIPTGIYTSFSSLYEVQIRPRSGNALKHKITITNTPGTIDSDYRDEWGVIIQNEGDEDFIISQGDRIAQAVFALRCIPQFIQKESVFDLSGINRGGGFGHTGK